MKKTIKKYPLLICMILSCVLVVTSLFILGFFGMNLGTSLGGGSQFEVVLPNDANASESVKHVKGVLKVNGFTMDSSVVEDKYVPTQTQGEFTKRCLVIKIAKTDISDSKETAIRYGVADVLDIDVSNVSAVDNITSVVKAKNVLFLGLAFGIIAICLFVMAWIRYDIFAGLSFILAYLHNLILYLSLLILTRVQLNLASLTVMVVLTLAMSALLIQIYEKNREETKMHTSEKMTVSERMLSSEAAVSKPYIFVGVAVLVFALLMFIVPVANVMFTAINIIIALAVTAYTSLLVAPGTYAYLLEVKDYAVKATLSRNDEVNKVIKKKVKKNTAKKAADKKQTEEKK